jgi:ABC-type Mn2+/Zn2+ transport system ATPase subunit
MIIKVVDHTFLPHTSCDIEFMLIPGEIKCITGPNGVGKSSFVKRLFRNHTNEVSIIQQNDLDIFYDRTLRKIKEIFHDSLPSTDETESFIDLWHKFSLSEKEDRMQSSLSGGEGQLLKICLGLVTDKKVIIMDEPSQYLDSDKKDVLASVIKNLSMQGKSILMIEHDISWIHHDMSLIELGIKDHTLRIVRSWNT